VNRLRYALRRPNPQEVERRAVGDLPRYIAMNAFAFGEWSSARTPVEERFAKALNRRFYEQAGIPFAADADRQNVPDQTPLVIKSVT